MYIYDHAWAECPGCGWRMLNGLFSLHATCGHDQNGQLAGWLAEQRHERQGFVPFQHHRHESSEWLWAAWHITRLLIKTAPSGVVLSTLFLFSSGWQDGTDQTCIVQGELQAMHD